MYSHLSNYAFSSRKNIDGVRFILLLPRIRTRRKFKAQFRQRARQREKSFISTEHILERGDYYG